MLNKKQKFTKGVIYEVFMFLLASGIIWIWFGSLKGSITVNLIITAIKMVCYYLNENIWEALYG